MLPSDPLDSREDPRHINSWYYDTVRACPVVWLGLMLVAAAIGIGAFWLVESAAPAMPGHDGANTVLRVVDPVPFQDYAASGVRAMVRADRWLGLATPGQGLAVLSLRNGFPVYRSSTPTTDLAEGPEFGSLLALRPDQGIHRVQRSARGWEESDWLAAPAAPRWQLARRFEDSDLFYAELDDAGLLLAARDAGIARYRFDTRAGIRVATRSWQQAAGPPFAGLQWVGGTALGFWLHGRSGELRFLDRETLAVDAARTRRFAEIEALSYGKGGDWLGAVAVRGAAWAYDRAAGWRGPWFSPASGGGLDAAAQVTVARLAGRMLWMGTRQGLHGYSITGHEMKGRLLDGPVRDLEPIGDSILVAGDAGVHVIDPQGKSLPLSDRGPGEFSISPDGRTLAVRAGAASASTVAVVDSNELTKPKLLGDTRWHGGEPPAVRAVVQQGDAVLLATDRGCLRYRLAGPTYADCSQARYGKEAENRRTLSNFTRLEQHDGALVAMADGRALAATAGTDWLALQTPGSLRQVTAAAGYVFGLDEGGALHRFGDDGSAEASLGAGRTEYAGVATGPGDLTGQDDDFRMLLVAGSRLHVYTSKSADWSSTDAGQSPRRALLITAGMAWVNGQGELHATAPGAATVGEGGLAFDPRSASALAQVPGEQALLVGGPEGRVAFYEAGRGRWTEPTPPVSGPGGAVAQVQAYERNILARRAQGQAHVWDGKQWKAWPGAARGWVLTGGEVFWRLDEQRISRSQGLRDVSDTVYAGGDQLQAMAGRARFIWQATPERVAVIADKSIGFFSRAQDSWSVTAYPFVLPRAVVARDAGLLMLTPPGAVSATQEPTPRPGAVRAQSSRLNLLRADGAVVDVQVSDGVVRDIAASASAADTVWLLHANHAAEYRLRSDGTLVDARAPVQTPSLVKSLAEATAGNPAIALAATNATEVAASLAYDGLQLDWSMSRPAGVQLRWRDRSDLPVWCGRGGRLALQCPTAIAATADGKTLLIDTPVGRFRRSASTFAFEGRTTGPYDTPPVAAGGVSWQLDGEGLAALRGGLAVDWKARGNGRWRLASDEVEDIRRIDDQTLALQTPAGVWSWTTSGQRGAAAAWPAPASARLDVRAMELRLRDNGISLSAFDGGSVFVDGRLFFDAADDVRGQGGGLYVIVGRRALLQRDPRQPHRVLSAMALPDSHRGAVSRLEASAAGIVVRSATGRIAPKAGGTGAMGWQLADPPGSTVELGPFEFLADATTARGRVVARSLSGERLELATWWSRGRFAWDDERAFGALDGQRVALATPWGITIRQASGAFERFLPVAGGLGSAGIARDGPRRLGTVFDGGRLLEDDAKLGLRLVDAPPASRQAAVVEVAAAPSGPGFREVWAAPAKGAAALRSAIGAVPTSALLHDGRFVFDAPVALGRLTVNSWLAVTGCQAPTGCLLARFEFDAAGPALRSVLPIARRLVSFRGGVDGALFARSIDGTAHRLTAVGALGAADAEAARAFVDGVEATLDISNLSWSGSPSQPGATVPRLRTSDGSKVPWLFQGTQAAFAYDIYDSIAGRREAGYDLAIATRHGVLRCPGLGASAPAVGMATVCRMSPPKRAQATAGWGVRLRWRDGALWLAEGATAVRVVDAGASQPAAARSPFIEARVAAHRITWDKSGLRVDGNLVAGSNNLLETDRRPIKEIVDWVYDTDTRRLWFGERQHGVFVLRLESF